MASIYKRGGKQNRSGRYLASYFNEHGKRVERSTGTTDYEVASRIAAKWENEIALRKQGIISTSQANAADANRRPLADHVKDYLEHCEHVGQDADHVAIKRSQLAKLLARTGAVRLSDLTPIIVERYLAGLVKAGKSHRTHNQNRATTVSFMQWCVEQSRVAGNDLKIVPMLNEAKDRRRVRRAMTEDELARLLAISDDRRLYYQFAYYTGMRVKAVKAAVWGDVDFDAAMIRVKVGNAKGKKDDIYLPLHPALIDELRKAQPAFVTAIVRIFHHVPRVETFHRDCKRARIERYDSEGRQLDRHALRTTLGTHLARAGVSPQLAMRVLGHADVQTTMKHYTALRISDTAKAVQTLPTISPKPNDEPAQLKATGTSNSLTADPQHFPQQSGGFAGHFVSQPVTSTGQHNSEFLKTDTHVLPHKSSGFGIDRHSQASTVLTHSDNVDNLQNCGRLAQLARAHGSHP
jgi:integrase